MGVWLGAWLVASFVIVWCLVWARSGGKFLFSGEDKYRTYFMCVVLGVDETKRGFFSLVGCKGFCRVTSVFVFGF